MRLKHSHPASRQPSNTVMVKRQTWFDHRDPATASPDVTIIVAYDWQRLLNDFLDRPGVLTEESETAFLFNNTGGTITRFQQVDAA